MATNFANSEHADQLQYVLRTLRVPGDAGFAKSGIVVDSIPMVVEFEINLTELTRSVGRLPIA
jgi:hypothetical protein